jgi:hypothetical protein
MGQGSSTPTSTVEVVPKASGSPEPPAGHFGVRYSEGGSGEDQTSAPPGSGSFSRAEMEAQIQQAYDAGQRDANDDSQTRMKHQQMSIVNDFQQKLDNIQAVDANAVQVMATGATAKLVSTLKTQTACLEEENAIVQCFQANNNQPLICAPLIAAYEQCAKSYTK